MPSETGIFGKRDKRMQYHLEPMTNAIVKSAPFNPHQVGRSLGDSMFGRIVK